MLIPIILHFVCVGRLRLRETCWLLPLPPPLAPNPPARQTPPPPRPHLPPPRPGCREPGPSRHPQKRRNRGKLHRSFSKEENGNFPGFPGRHLEQSRGPPTSPLRYRRKPQRMIKRAPPPPRLRRRQHPGLSNVARGGPLTSRPTNSDPPQQRTRRSTGDSPLPPPPPPKPQSPRRRRRAPPKLPKSPPRSPAARPKGRRRRRRRGGRGCPRWRRSWSRSPTTWGRWTGRPPGRSSHSSPEVKNRPEKHTSVSRYSRFICTVGTYLLRLKESGEPRITHLTQAGKTVHVMVGRGGRPNQEAAASAEQGATEGYYVGSSTWAETLDGLIREFSEPGLKRYHFEKPYNGGGV